MPPYPDPMFYADQEDYIYWLNFLATELSDAWDAIGVGGGGGLAAVSHDSTLTGDGTSGDPLGVDSSLYATAAQGATADTAAAALATLIASLGSSAFTASTAYATAAQGAKADSAVQPAALAGYEAVKSVGTASLTGANALDWSGKKEWRITLTGNVTFSAFNNLADGDKVILTIIQGGSGSYTVTWPASVRYTDDNPSITLLTAVNAQTIIGFRYNGTSSKSDVMAVTRMTTP